MEEYDGRTRVGLTSGITIDITTPYAELPRILAARADEDTFTAIRADVVPPRAVAVFIGAIEYYEDLVNPGGEDLP